MEPKKSNSGIVITLVVLVLGAIAVFAFSGPSKQDKMMMEEKEVMEQKMMMEKESMMKLDTMKDDAMMKKDGAMMQKDSMVMSNGSYEMYSPEKLAWAKDGKVVIFFKASWCPSCKAVDADIKANLSSIPKGVHILELDYDKSSELKKKYGVTYQHTFVQVDSNGTQIAKWSGSPTLASLITNIK